MVLKHYSQLHEGLPLGSHVHLLLEKNIHYSGYILERHRRSFALGDFLMSPIEFRGSNIGPVRFLVFDTDNPSYPRPYLQLRGGDTDRFYILGYEVLEDSLSLPHQTS